MLTQHQINISLITGIVFWVLFALAIRALPMVFNAGVWNAVLFALTIPLGWVLVDLMKLIAGAKDVEVVTATTLAFAIAFLVDGIVLTWLDWVYGDTAVHTRTAAAYILYGAGVTLMWAIYRMQTNKL